MIIRWNGKRWLIMPGDMTDTEYRIVKENGYRPEYHDNWAEGDILMYDKTLHVGVLWQILNDHCCALRIERIFGRE